MSNKHNIDQLFKDGLQGRNAAGDPDLYWSGAEQLLDNHFKWLWIKKALYFAIPLAILTLASGAFLMNESDGAQANESAVSSAAVAPAKNTMDNSKTSIEPEQSESSNKIITAEDSLASVESPEKTRQLLTLASAAKEGSEVEEDVSNKTTGLRQDPISNSSHSSSSAGQEEPLASNETLEDPIDPKAILPSQTEATTPNSTAIKRLDGMPAFSINTLGLANTSGIGDRDQLKKESLMNELRKLEVSAHLGGVLAPGLQNIKPARDPIGYGAYTGVTVEYYFNQRIYGKTGALLHMRNSLASGILIQKDNAYVSPNQLVYMDIPIQVGYRFGARHSINFGMSFSPLVDVLTQPSDQQPTENEWTLANTKDVRSGFANFDVAGLLGYEMQLTSKLDFQAQFRYGLFDVTDNTFWNVNLVDDRNHQLRVGFSYRLLNR